MDPIPPIHPPQGNRQTFKHRQRQIEVSGESRAKDYFKNNVTPLMNTFLQHVAEQKPDDVLAFMFAFSRRKLAERQLDEVPETAISTNADVSVSRNADDDAKAQTSAATTIQARHRGRNDRQRVLERRSNGAMDARTVEEDLHEQRTEERLRERKAEQEKKAAAAAAAPKGKAKKMGSLLMKAKKDGSLEARVDSMEAALEE